jgi:iron complex outermembrane recepter protein
MKKAYLLFFTLVLGLGFSGIPWALAQEGSSNEFTLEEITVTAEKRVENLQKVSMSVSVLKGEDVMNTGATTIADILKDIPNVSTSDSGTAGGLTINIRGLGNDMPTGMGESSVSTNFDGAYESRGESTLFGYFDIDRVEVLRGPQGTLYGRNASGGVLNVVSAKPRIDKVEGYASLEVASYDKRRVEAAVNVPISEKFAGRLAFVSTQEDATTHDDHGYSQDSAGLGTRLQLRYVPNDEAYINLLYNYTKQTGQSWSDILKTNWEAGIYDINRNLYPYDLTSKNKTKTTKLALTAEFPVGPGILTALPSYETSKGLSSGDGRDGTFSISKSPYNYTAKIAEVRYANKADSNIKWTIGLYYTKTEDPRDLSFIPTRGGAASMEYSDEAAFTQITYPFSDTFRGIIGGRYDSSKKRYYDAIKYLSDSGSASFNYADYKLGIEKDFAKEMMGYFTLASGHKAGGFGDTGKPFGKESNTSGELGLKSRLLDNRLQLNGDVFYYQYKGYQVVDGWAEIDSFGNFTFHMNFENAPAAKSEGAEIESTALIGDATSLTMNFSYLKNEYTKSFIVHPDGVETNLKGLEMPHSPKYTILLALDHTFDFSDGSTLRPKVSYKWIAKQYAGFIISDANLAPAYGIVDFTMSYTASKSWSLNFYANDALDKHYFTMIQGAGTVVFPGEPRKVGATLNVKF